MTPCSNLCNSACAISLAWYASWERRSNSSYSRSLDFNVPSMACNWLSKPMRSSLSRLTMDSYVLRMLCASLCLIIALSKRFSRTRICLISGDASDEQSWEPTLSSANLFDKFSKWERFFSFAAFLESNFLCNACTSDIVRSSCCSTVCGCSSRSLPISVRRVLFSSFSCVMICAFCVLLNSAVSWLAFRSPSRSVNRRLRSSRCSSRLIAAGACIVRGQALRPSRAGAEGGGGTEGRRTCRYPSTGAAAT
mmetsp:Transcript_53082/g.149031  ORF Transcript_53082/g.149031 Transcript_53082/m.149031 type:complete len:251 (-) Transcript_53082:14-766(-)